MKITTNVFLEGIQTDLHPLSTSQQVLTDALNATMLTYNGNEMMLLNDMGNTLIQDSATGNIMGLNPGFIPTGIKEHGGIMYITSVGKDANGNPIGEIGTIPSPIIRDIYKDKITYNVNNVIPIGLGDPLTITHKLYPADKFIVNLDMKVDTNDLVGTLHYKASALSGDGGKPDGDPSDIVLSRKVVSRNSSNNPVLKDLYTPLISYADSEDKKVQLLQQTRSTNEVDLFSTKGVYSLDMYSTNVNGSKKVSGPLTYPLQYNGGASKYWYLHNDEYESVFPKDLFEATLNKSLKQFPSSNKPGQLAVKLTPENIGEFGMLPRKNDPKNTPITVKWNHPVTNYKSFFPGFYYSTDSGIYIDYLKNIKVIDESTGKEVSLHNPYSGLVNNIRFNFTGSTVQTQPPANPSFSKDLNVWNRTYGVPLTLSGYKESSNYFILSYAVDINDHTKTDFVSSDVSMEDSPHTGLFYANLGAKYNNWYRLELDYYDQYDNLQGSFSTRFNPYINDTFGTNLDITGVEMADGVAMGGDRLQKTLHPEKDATKDHYDISSKYTLKISTDYPYNLALFENDNLLGLNLLEYSYFTDPEYASQCYDTTTAGVLFPVHSPTLTNLKYVQTSETTKVNISFQTTPYKIGGLEPLANGMTELGLLLEPKNGEDKGENTRVALWMVAENSNGDKYWYNANRGFPRVDSPLSIGFRQFYIYDDPNKKIELIISDDFSTGTNKLEGQEAFWLSTSTDDVNNLATSRGFVVDENTPDIFPFELNITDKYIENSTEIGLNNKKEKIPAIFGTLHYADDSPDSDDWLKAGNYTAFSFDSAKGGIAIIPPSFELKSSKHFSDIKYTFDYTITPAYKITPYFLLTGTADTTSSVYPRRFVSYEKLDQNKGFKYKSMPYEYNLEKIPAAFNITLDIILVENSSYLKELDGYKQGISDVKLTLDAGIYTLNMTGVPNKLKDTATITINNTKLNIHTQGELKTESGTVIANQFYFYQPVVFMLEQRGEVTVSARDLEAFQEIGLYKVNTIDVDSIPAFIDMYTKAGGSTVCTYKEYMNSLIKTIKAQDSDGQNKLLLPSERYALIQKYGIFFKEAYVFTEGLYDAKDKTINGVEIADSTNGNSLTYTAAPYIPADTSILPVNLQPDLSGELVYAWNIYVMPNSILETDYEDNSVSKPDFVFTNGVPEKVSPSTEPKLGNLRRLANKVFEIDALMKDKFKDHLGSNNAAIGGMLPSVSIK